MFQFYQMIFLDRLSILIISPTPAGKSESPRITKAQLSKRCHDGLDQRPPSKLSTYIYSVCLVSMGLPFVGAVTLSQSQIHSGAYKKPKYKSRVFSCLVPLFHIQLKSFQSNYRIIAVFGAVLTTYDIS